MKLHSFSLLLVLSLVTSIKALDDTVNAFVENVKSFKCTTWRVSHSTLHVAKKALGIAPAMHTPEEIEKSLLRIDDHVKPQFQRPTNVTANSEEMIYRHLLYAAMTYCNDTMPAQRISNVHLGPNKRPLLVGGFNITNHYEKDNLSHYVAVNEQQQSIVLTFRGSTHFVNYRDAADIVRVRPNSEFFGETPNDAKVFEGYQYAATSQLVEAANALEQAYKTHPNYAVILVGHSLGGAIAHLAAIYIKRKRNIPVSFIYTYGEPVIGNIAFDDWTASVIGPVYQRVISSDDIVPFLGQDDSRLMASDKRAGHSAKISEIYLPNPFDFGVIYCKDDLDPRCSEAQPCTEKRWDNHSNYAGFRSAKQICTIPTRNVLNN